MLVPMKGTKKSAVIPRMKPTKITFFRPYFNIRGPLARLDTKPKRYPKKTSQAAALKAWSGVILYEAGSSKKKIRMKKPYEEKVKLAKKTPNIDKIVKWVTPCLQLRKKILLLHSMLSGIVKLPLR